MGPATKAKKRRRRSTDVPVPQGPVDFPGETDAQGGHGARGDLDPAAAPGAETTSSMALLAIVEAQIETIYRELDRRAKQMARFQEQVDQLRSRGFAKRTRRRDPEHPIGRSYARRQGDYLYDIEMHEVGQTSSFFAKAVNMVRLAPGRPMSVNPDLPGQYGATHDEAYSSIEATVAHWVNDQTGAEPDTSQR
jgi:hypothetical protein